MIKNHQIFILEKKDGPYHHQYSRNMIPNYDFYFFETLNDCLRAIEAQPCSLLVADTDLYPLTTAEYCSKIRAANPDIPVFFVGDYNAKPKAFEISTGDGNDFYFPKPVSPKIMLANMNTVLYMDRILEIYKKKKTVRP